MKLVVRFTNYNGDFVKTTVPLVYTKTRSEAHIVEIDTDKDDITYVTDTYVIPVLTEIISYDTAETHYMVISDTADVDYYKADISKRGVMLMSHTKNECPDKDVDSYVKALITNIVPELTDVYMRASLTSSKRAKKLFDAIMDTDGSDDTVSKPKASGISDEDKTRYLEKLVHQISKDTKAEIVKPKESLKDYVCTDTLMEELLEIKDFFENSAVYKTNNVQIPKGILFKGPWGTGKTYAARCIAGSVDCYFMTCTASALQGMYIGSGAENIRNLFKGAKELAKESGKGVIIFIDELDSFGDRQSRGASSSGEEDRTLNQLLAEMSGFTDTEDIMVLAATNFPERLDSALLRSGRFGRQITISYPEDAERLSLVKYYFDKLNIKLDSSVEYIDIAELTKGLTPSDIKEISNESAILAIRQKLSNITLDCVNEAINKVITKDIRKPDKSKKELELVTAHECGHVLAEVIYNKSYPIKVTNYAYGDAGGFTQSAHLMEGIMSRHQFRSEVKMLLAGRAAELVLCGYITNGASNDISKAKNILLNYFKYYNFGDYEVDKLDQTILDTLNSLYEDVVADFRKPEYKKALETLVFNLSKQRVLYKSDIIPLLTTCKIHI